MLSLYLDVINFLKRHDLAVVPFFRVPQGVVEKATCVRTRLPQEVCAKKDSPDSSSFRSSSTSADQRFRKNSLILPSFREEQGSDFAFRPTKAEASLQNLFLRLTVFYFSQRLIISSNIPLRISHKR